LLVETIEEVGELFACEVPVEWFGDLVAVVLELVQPAGDLGEPKLRRGPLSRN
jgi:hypothetical protein